MPPLPRRASEFFYDGYTIDPSEGVVTCTYSTGGLTFTERFRFGADGDWGNPAVPAAVRLLFLLAGVSYYKTTAAPVIQLTRTTTSAPERAFLLRYYLHGLGEFAYRNGIDLAGLSINGPEAHGARAADYTADPGRPLIPFGGGIDSLVTVAALARRDLDSALCIVHPPGQRFAAIEDAAAATGLPITRISRELDPLVRRSDELGFFNGHVPITAVITAAALVAAVLAGRDAVVLSNEWSASIPTLIVDRRPVNHQWSKGDEFEQDFARLVAESLGPQMAVFSYLRPRSELWVAREFAGLSQFHGVFRSCNRAFHQDPAQRLDTWCGRCDKCCFIDLILSPFMSTAALSDVFGGHEPLAESENRDRFRRLLGLELDAKPFECVGDIGECRAAVLVACERGDRAGHEILHQLRQEMMNLAVPITVEPDTLLNPVGPHSVPERYAPPDLLVRAH
jgi:UDP-N-acetyl-alpha-D-muramoyl-L-alanyl-L-glutamate epimerase